MKPAPENNVTIDQESPLVDATGSLEPDRETGLGSDPAGASHRAGAFASTVVGARGRQA